MRMRMAAAPAVIGFCFSGAAAGMDSNVSKGGEIADPIPARQEMMKMNGAAWGASRKMITGDTAYNTTEAASAMAVIKSNMERLPMLFPDDSMNGDTRAKAAIWDNKADFEARAAKLSADAAVAEQAAAKGKEAFAAAFAVVSENCSGCHENYRASAK